MAMQSNLVSFARTHFSKSLATLYDFIEKAPNLFNIARKVTLDHAGPNTLPTDAYQVLLATSQGGAGDPVALPDPATIGVIGQRHLIKLGTVSKTGDTAVVSKANLSYGSANIAAVSLTAAGKWLLVEHRGTTWEVIAAAAGVVTTA
jgi:hypothetical protein